MCVWENEKIEVNLAWPLGERLARLSSYLFQMNGGFKSGCLKGVGVCVCEVGVRMGFGSIQYSFVIFCHNPEHAISFASLVIFILLTILHLLKYRSYAMKLNY